MEKQQKCHLEDDAIGLDRVSWTRGTGFDVSEKKNKTLKCGVQIARAFQEENMSSVTGPFKFPFSLDAQKKLSIDRYLFIHTKELPYSGFSKAKAKHRTKINPSILRHKENSRGETARNELHCEISRAPSRTGGQGWLRERFHESNEGT